MKLFLPLLFVLACSSPQKQALMRHPASEGESYERINQSALDGVYFKSVGTGEKFVISKARFTSHGEAKKFCSLHKLPMATMLEVMIFNMATEGKVDFIREGTTFEFKEDSKTGIWVWLPEKQKAAELMIMFDSGFSDGDAIAYSSIKAKLEKEKIEGIPAVCGKYPEVQMPIPIPSPGEDS